MSVECYKCIKMLIRKVEKRCCPLVVLCDGRSNPYRQLIPLMESSLAVTNAILAIGACHYVYSTAYLAISSGEESTTPSMVTTRIPHIDDAFTSTSSILSSYLRFKQKALQHLSIGMSNLHKTNHASVLATVILMIILELFESGAGSWTIHLKGAKELLLIAPTASNTDSQRIMKGVKEELAV